MDRGIWGDGDQDLYEKTFKPGIQRRFGTLPPKYQAVYWRKLAGLKNEEIARLPEIDVTLETVDHYWAEIRHMLSEFFRRADLSDEDMMQLGGEYFRYCHALLSNTEPDLHLSRSTLAQAAMDLLAGRAIAAYRAAYPAALDRYRDSWRLVEPYFAELEGFERLESRGRGASRSTLHLLGLLTHEIANARAMAGDVVEATQFAARSAFCYQLLDGAVAKPSVFIGQLRAMVVRQQADAYAGRDQEVVHDSAEIDQWTKRRTDTTDEYGLAKSHHFRALTHWFGGRYPDAIREAHESLDHANRIDPKAWLRTARDGRTLGWLQLIFRPRTFLQEADSAWFIRDGGEYGRDWWLAISTATLADLLACQWHFGGNDQDRVEAKRLYVIARSIVKRASALGLFRGIARMPSAQGLYEWLTFTKPDGFELDLHVEEYLRQRVAWADSSALLYYRCLVRACQQWHYAQSLGEEDGMTERARQKFRDLAHESGNPSLIGMSRKSRMPFAPEPI